MHELIGKRIRADRGFFKQTEPWFGTVLDVAQNGTVYIRFNNRTSVHQMGISEYNENFFVVENNCEIDE